MLKQMDFDNDVKSNLIEKRAMREKLMSRMAMLDKSDRTILNMHLEKGYTYKQMSAMAGVSESTICRRVQRISQRLMSEKISLFYDNRHKFEANERHILKDHIRHGLSQRKISEKRNVTRYKIRKAIEKFETLGCNFLER